MDSENTNIPEEYVDMLLQEFAYDPIRLPLTEDPNQVLYNRRTLEKIWDAKHEAVNPFTRQPFDINNVIPQTDLRREMHRYIVLNSSNQLALSLKVIPDYTQVLSEGEMIILLNKMISDHQRLVNAKENRDPQAADYWKGLWQKLNLLRLYCQYRPENRELFESIRGYDYLSKVVDRWFHLLMGYFFASCDDAKEGFKEVAKILDVIGLKDCNLPPEFLYGIVTTLKCLVMQCDHQKIHSMVLRIYRRMFYELNIERHVRSWLQGFLFSTVFVTVYTLERKDRRNISNEDLYNGLAILKAAWLKNQDILCVKPHKYVGVVVDSVILCISRIHYLHEAANGDGEAVKNVHLISVALEGGLWLINSVVTDPFFSEGRMTLQESDIIREIVGMVELVLAGLKWVGSSHLQFGINIVAALLNEEDFERRNDLEDVVQVFGDFLGSHILDEYDSHVKLLLQDTLQTAKLSEQTLQLRSSYDPNVMEI